MGPSMNTLSYLPTYLTEAKYKLHLPVYLSDWMTWIRPGMNTFLLSRIWGSHGGEYEDCCLLGCSTV
jgi:hypothetical protein